MKQHVIKRLLGYHGKHGEHVYQCTCLGYIYAWTLEEAYKHHRLEKAYLDSMIVKRGRPKKTGEPKVREIVKLACIEGHLPGCSVTKEENAYIQTHLTGSNPPHPQDKASSDDNL